MQIDTTQLNTWQACGMKYYLQFVCGLKKVEEGITDIDLRFGSAVHKCKEIYYKGRGITDEQIKEVWQGFIDLPESYEERSKTRQNGIKLVQDYVALYGDRDKDWEILGVEKKIEIPIGEDRYAVKLDLIIKVNGNVYAVEHKTTSRISPTFFSKFSPNTQISAQTAACIQEYGECSGVIVNALETGFHSNFQREIVNRTKEQVEDFKTNVMMEIAKLKTDTQMGLFGKHEQRCHDYKSGCQFKELCISCADESVLSNLYEKVEDPYAYLKEV